MNDENEIIKFSCEGTCKKCIEGTYKEFFGDLPSLAGMPNVVCKCGGSVSLEFTGRYKEQNEEEKKKPEEGQ